MGVPEHAIIREDKARHTFDNAVFSYERLKTQQINLDKVILVCKNFHSRRAYLTYKINFPKATQFIVQPIVDGKGLTKDDWMHHEEHRHIVLSEVAKIGQYFPAHLDKLL